MDLPATNQQRAYMSQHDGFLIPRKPLLSNWHEEFEYEDIKRGEKLQNPIKLETATSKYSATFWTYPWTLEVLSLLLSFAMLAAIIVTLVVHRDRSLPQWPGLISINSLIAIFTSILKASLILPVAEGLGQLKWQWFRETRPLIDLDRLDSATRGPWGSLLVLWTHYRSLLISLGALITVVALAIDPFSQQVVQYKDCLEISNGATATIPTATNYTRYGTATSAKDVTLDSQTASGLYSGLLDPPKNASAALSFTCDSGNCTFPQVNGITHRSLAMCGVCKDRTSAVVSNYSKSTDGNNDRLFQILPANTDQSFSVPGNASISMFAYANSSANRNTDTWLSTHAYASNYPSWYISAFDALMYRNCSCTDNMNATTNACTCDILGANCAIFPCLKEYKARVRNFILEEEEVSSVPIPNGTFNPGVDYGIYIDKAIRDSNSYDCSISDTESDEFPIPIIAEYLYDNITEETTYRYDYYPQGCIYNFGYQPAWAMKLYLTQNIWGGSLIHSTTNRPYAAVGQPWLQAMFNNGSATIETLQQYIDGLTNTLTAIIREHGESPEVTRLRGDVYVNRTCVKVRWAWLSLPAGLLVLSTIFLAITIWVSNRERDVVWKSSPLAILFHGFDQNFADQHRAITRVEEMRDAARTIPAKMEVKGGRWSFIRSSSDSLF